jgi:hypothetical protein
MMSFRTLSAFVLLAAILPCQERPSEEEGDRNAMDRRIRAAKAGSASEAKQLLEEGKITEEELNGIMARANATREGVHGASAFCRFFTAMKPAKLMPGQTGTMVVTGVLSGQAVIPAPAALERVSGTQAGLVTLGGLSIRPPEIGRLAPSYLGQPVYDNYVVIEIPVTMSTEAEVGKKQAVQVDFRFEIFDGTTAQSIGRFIDRATAEVEVGQALDPAVKGFVRGEVKAPTDDGRVTLEPAASAESAPDPATAGASRVIEGQAPRVGDKPVVQPADSGIASADPEVGIEEPMAMMPILVGGGLLLLVVILMVARKK